MRATAVAASAALVLLVSACAHRGPASPVGAPGAGTRERGLASWYGHPYHGRRTASGEVYDMYAMTAAHRTLPFGTRVRVTRRDDGRWVDVRINDRGPFVRRRIIDLSYSAACRIGLDRDGVTPVELEVLPAASAPEPAAAPAQPPVPAAVPAVAPAAGCWWVQVGAFSDLDNARRARERLAEAGETVVVMEGPHGLARVRLGPFDSDEAAAGARGRVLGNWPAAAIVRCGE